MKKYAYLARLEELLEGLPAAERQDALNYYEEYFDAAGPGNEEATAAALGDPAQVARTILEAQDSPAPEPPTSAPEPPAMADAGLDAAKGIGAAMPRPFRKRGWRIFLVVVSIVLLIQLVVLVLNLSTRGEQSTLAAATEYTASEAVVAAETSPDQQF